MKDRLAFSGKGISRSLNEIRDSTKAAIGFVLWLGQPNSRSLLHLDDDDGSLHPFGSRWIETPQSAGRICNHCQSLHPHDFVRAVEGLTRWDPGAAYLEMCSLIERGEAERTLGNAMRWQHAPQGAAVFSVIEPHGAGARIHAHTGDCRSLWFSVRHLTDIPRAQFDAVVEWMAEHLPEYVVVKSDNGLACDYDPALDPMNSVPRPVMPMMIIGHHEGDPDSHDD